MRFLATALNIVSSGSFAIGLRTPYSTFNDPNTVQSRFSDSRLFEVPFHPSRWLKDCCILDDRKVFDFFTVHLNSVYSVIILLFYYTIH